VGAVGRWPYLSLPSMRCTNGRARSLDRIQPASAGTLRDPDNFGKQWREVRESLGLPEVTSHSFRKTGATLIDDSGLSARVGADQLGHARPSMTQDVYMSRGQVHTRWPTCWTRRSVYPTNNVGLPNWGG
jgi:integrase